MGWVMNLTCGTINKMLIVGVADISYLTQQFSELRPLLVAKVGKPRHRTLFSLPV